MFWYKKKFFLFMLGYICSLVLSANIFSALPAWRIHRDPDGNKYYINRNAKIRTSEKPDFKYKAVSLAGLDYYLEQGRALVKRQHKIEGLTLLKSVKILGNFSSRAAFAAARAGKEINLLLKMEGGRFKKINQSASLLLVRVNNEVHVYNDYIPYSFHLPGSVAIIKKKIISKHNYVRYGVSFGINFNSSAKKQKAKYELLLIINSEKFHYPLNSIEKYQKMCRNKSVHDNFQRKILKDRQDQRIFIFTTKNSKNINYKGYELFLIKGNNGYFIQIVSEKNLFNDKKDRIKKLIDSLVIP